MASARDLYSYKGIYQSKRRRLDMRDPTTLVRASGMASANGDSGDFLILRNIVITLK